MGFLSAIAKTAGDFVRQAAPEVVREVVHHARQDPRLGKIVAGVGFTAMGVGLVLASGVPSRIRSWVWNQPSTFAAESRSKQVMRLGMAAVGVASIGYGISNIVTGIGECIYPGVLVTEVAPEPTRQAVQPSESLQEKPSKARIRNIVCKSDYHRSLLEETARQILDCPQGKQLWESVEKGGRFTIKCGSRQEASGDAITDSVQRRITISSTNPLQLPYVMLTELSNLKRAHQFLEIQRPACSSTPTKYAKEMQTLEYQSVKESSGILDQCFPDVSGGVPYVRPRHHFASLKKFLEAMDATGHTAEYQQQWAAACR